MSGELRFTSWNRKPPQQGTGIGASLALSGSLENDRCSASRKAHLLPQEHMVRIATINTQPRTANPRMPPLVSAEVEENERPTTMKTVHLACCGPPCTLPICHLFHGQRP